MKLFNVEKTSKHKVISFLGVKIKLKKQTIQNVIKLEDLRAYMLSLGLHSSLKKYRGIFTGKDVLVVGGGDSLNYFDILPKDTINIGINRAFKLEYINFDYLFVQDAFPEQKEVEEFINYKEDTCKKFLGIHPYVAKFSIKNSTICRIKNKELYVLNNRRPNQSILPKDISVEPFARYDGTVFAVLQFAMYANAKRIFLAGFDCNVSHMFTKDETKHNLTRQNKYWLEFKKYINSA